jgi:TRAP-type C4-dicarboxylate transport system permease small subunit
MANLLHRVPQFAATLLIVIAIANLLIGVFLRYFVGAITDYLDIDPVPYVWVEEVGEMALAWLTLIGAAIGVRQRSHFTLHVLVHRLPASYQRIIEILNHLLIAIFGIAVAWYGVGLSRMNMGLSTPGLGISMGWLYVSSVVGGVLLAIYAISMIIQPSLVIGDADPLKGGH